MPLLRYDDLEAKNYIFYTLSDLYFTTQLTVTQSEY